jgi:Tol biopolymer transport system component
MFAVQVGQGRFVSVPMAAGEVKEYPVWETFSTWLEQQYAWSQDGSFLLVTGIRKGVGLGIHRYELASGATETLVKTMNTQVPGHWVCHARFSPDGNSFYYLWRDFIKDADGGTDCKDRILRRNLRSGNEEIAYESPEMLHIWWPYELSPEGARLAIVTSNDRGTNDFVVALKVRSVSGSETREVVRMAPRENVTSLAWTPDGKRLVYTKERANKVEVWSTTVDSGQSVELKLSQPAIHDISIHPEGRQIAFCAGVSSSPEVWVMEGLMPKAVVQAAPTTNK